MSPVWTGFASAAVHNERLCEIDIHPWLLQQNTIRMSDVHLRHIDKHTYKIDRVMPTSRRETHCSSASADVVGLRWLCSKPLNWSMSPVDQV